MVFFGCEDKWEDVKTRALNYLIENSPFLLSDFPQQYISDCIAAHSQEGCWADDLMF